MDKFTKKKPLESEQKQKSQQQQLESSPTVEGGVGGAVNKNNRSIIPQHFSLNNESPTTIKSTTSSSLSIPSNTNQQPNNNKFKLPSFFDPTSRSSPRSSIESTTTTHSHDTLDSRNSEMSTTSTTSRTSTRTLFAKGGSLFATFRSSADSATNNNNNGLTVPSSSSTLNQQQQQQQRKSAKNLLSSSFSSSVSSTSSPPLSPLHPASMSYNSRLDNNNNRQLLNDSRRPTIEELINARNLKNIEGQNNNEEDETSDWSSISSSSVKPTTSAAAAGSLAGLSAARGSTKSNATLQQQQNVKKPKRLEKLAPSLSTLSNLGYDEDDFMDAFRVFDTNGDGRITAKELNHVLKELGIKMTRNEIKKMIGELDKDGNGTIEYSEFVAMMTAPASRESDEFELREAFKCIDLDGNGFISRDELKDAVRKIMSTDSKVSVQDVEEMMREADTDGNGLIDFDEFVRVLVEKRN